MSYVYISEKHIQMPNKIFSFFLFTPALGIGSP